MTQHPTPTRRRDSLSRALRAIADGSATSRSDLAEHLGVSASTASLLVKRLVDDGLVEELGAGESTGGRRPIVLRAVTPDGHIAVAELGGSHVRYGLCDLAGDLQCVAEFPHDIAEGPRTVLTRLHHLWAEQAAEHATSLQAAALALPGPVNALTGEVSGPSRMPGWHSSRPGELLTELMNVPIYIENDARAAALGEYSARRRHDPDLIYVKAGTGIGAGYVSKGRLHHGGGVAGDIAHVRVTDEPDVRCACGRHGCLESVASGAAIRAHLATDGVVVHDLRDLIDQGGAAHPQISAALRAAGDHLGRALAPLVNFLNPQTVVIGGGLSGADAFFASLRSALYAYCLPMCTQDLAIETARGGADAALRGLGALVRDHLLTDTTTQRPPRSLP